MQLITWNIQWGRGVDGRVDLDRIVAHAKRLADFDVLCLQEISGGYTELPGSDGGDQFADLARRLPGYHALDGVATEVWGASGHRRFGNMIFSRYPLLRACRYLLPWQPQSGTKSMQRIALEATLVTPSGPLRVTTTHLEYYDPAQRMAQVSRLRELHREAVAHARAVPASEPSEGAFYAPARGGPAILTGDFNFLPDSAEYRSLTAPIDADTPPYRDAWRLAHAQLPHAPSVGMYDKAQWPGAPFTFDFLFVSEDLGARVREVSVDDTSDASDHQPTLLTLA